MPVTLDTLQILGAIALGSSFARAAAELDHARLTQVGQAIDEG